jgi:hypothetical protein
MFRNRCPQDRLFVMKDPIEVLHRKEAELLQLQEEVEALRIAGEILSDHNAAGRKPGKRGKVLQMPVNLA